MVINECPNCGQELDHLDVITNRDTGKSYDLWICHNEDCSDYGTIWNDAQSGFLNLGDPSGIY